MSVRRLNVAVVAGVVCLLAVLTATGLLTDHPVGAGDNGDGFRLYCGAGLVSATPDGEANWKGGVVLQFNRDTPCRDVVPSSALPILRVAAYASGDGWSLARLGWLYAVLAGAITLIAAWAAAGAGLTRVLVLLPPVLPLFDANFSRFFVSTYGEPAGLLGAFAVVCGVGTIAVTKRTHLAERMVGLVLVAGGGLLAATAKAAYAPLLALAVLLCAVTAVSLWRAASRWNDYGAGALLAVVTALLALVPVTAALDWRSQHFSGVNAHNMIYTMMLTEVPGSATEMGLPGAAARSAGDAYYPNGPTGAPGWDVVAANPNAAQSAGIRTLADHPAALLRSVGVGMQATEGSALSYLPSKTWTPSTQGALDTLVGEQGATGSMLRAWLARMKFPWWPSLLAALGMLAGLAGAVGRGRLWSSFARLAGVAAIAALGLVTVAVLGDGYFEVAKHVWLAAYLLEVTLFGLAGAVLSVGAEALRSWHCRGRVIGNVGWGQAAWPGTGANPTTATAAATTSDVAAKTLRAGGNVPSSTRTTSAAIQPNPERR